MRFNEDIANSISAVGILVEEERQWAASRDKWIYVNVIEQKKRLEKVWSWLEQQKQKHPKKTPRKHIGLWKQPAAFVWMAGSRKIEGNNCQRAISTIVNSWGSRSGDCDSNSLRKSIVCRQGRTRFSFKYLCRR